MTAKASSAIAGKLFIYVAGTVIAAALAFYLNSSITKCGYIDKDGNLAISFAGLSDGGEFYEGLAPVKIERGWGYINNAGQWVIPPQFAQASNFSEGLAAVKVGQKRFAYIRPNASAAFEISADAVGDFHEGLAMIASDGKCGYINKEGKFIIPQVYFFEGNHYSSDGAIPVKIKTTQPGAPSWILIDQLNRPIFKSNFYGATEVGEQLAGICVSLEKDSAASQTEKTKQDTAGSIESSGKAKEKQIQRWGYIDTSGNYVIRPQYLAASPFSDGMASVAFDYAKTNAKNLVFTYIDKNGKQLPLKLKSAGQFSEGLAAVCDLNKETLGYIDLSANYKIRARFTRACRFSEGLAFTSRGPLSRWWWDKY